jgi:hypothetical protein
MIRTSIAREPTVEDGKVVVHVVVEDPGIEETGRVVVCHLRSFDDVVVATFPEGKTPSSPGEYRVAAATAARKLAADDRARFEALFAQIAATARQGG